MALWRKRATDGERGSTVVVGSVMGDSLFTMRATRAAENTAPMTLREAILPWTDAAAIPGLLEQRLGWRSGEPVHIALPSPPMFGSAVPVSFSRVEDGHAVVRDMREMVRAAQWEAQDAVREDAAAFFGMPLEDLAPLGTRTERWRESGEDVRGVLTHLVAPRASVPVVDVSSIGPDVHPAFLPLLLAQQVGNGTEPEALLHTEEGTTVFAVRRENILCEVRSAAIGAAAIVEHVQREFACGDRDAELLLRLCMKEKLSPERRNTIRRVVRSLLPLWTGMFDVFGAVGAPGERPVRVLVTGLLAPMVRTFFCRPQVLHRCTADQVKLDSLPDRNSDTAGIFTMLAGAADVLTQPVAAASRVQSVRTPALSSVPVA